MIGLPGLPTSCRSPHHILVQWNTTGPQGPAGPQGSPGPAFSLTGTGVLGELEVVSSGYVDVPVGDAPSPFIVQCPAGKKAIISVLGDYPTQRSVPGALPGDWGVTAWGGVGTTVQTIAYVVCAREF